MMIIGFIVLGVGFNFRENEWGIRIMLVGTILMLVPIGFRIYLAIH